MKHLKSIEEFKKVKDMLPAVTTMVGIMNQNDPEMKHMLESLTLFVNHLDELIGVFDNEYSGGDFCAGLTFGQAGSNLLYKMASIIINENVKALNKNKKSRKKITICLNMFNCFAMMQLINTAFA